MLRGYQGLRHLSDSTGCTDTSHSVDGEVVTECRWSEGLTRMPHDLASPPSLRHPANTSNGILQCFGGAVFIAKPRSVRCGLANDRTAAGKRRSWLSRCTNQ